MAGRAHQAAAPARRPTADARALAGAGGSLRPLGTTVARPVIPASEREDYLLYRLNSSTALVPPNPKLLLITASTRTSRGVFGT